MKKLDFRFIDFIPAISGLLGKIALVSSFAYVWAEELRISNAFFVFNNIRLELIIVSIFTLIMLFIYPKATPAGTLAPLVVMIPMMASYGVHPLMLSILVGLIGIIFIKTGIFSKLLNLSGLISKAGISLVFGISGVILSVNHLYDYFNGNLKAFLLILIILGLLTIYFLYIKKLWFMIPVSIIISFIVLSAYEPIFQDLNNYEALRFSPNYWWNDVWGIGYGMSFLNFFKALPFAIFIIILWTVDTASIMTVHDSIPLCNVSLDVEASFVGVSLRNIIGGIMGGAQTASIWRSFLIPQFMVNRPMKNSVIIMCIMGLLIGIFPLPLRILTLPPLMWSVLIFGIFIPLIFAGLISLMKIKSKSSIIICLLAVIPGLIINSFITYIVLVFYEKLKLRKEMRNN